MAKPRVIIADTDVNYIIPLQLKFVEDFFEKVDLEIITNKEYYNELFSVPQKIDILIVSEDLYNQSLGIQNISNVFLMTEYNEDEQTTDLNVTQIYKYTSIKEIFNEIIGKSSSVTNIEEKTKKETVVILVYSACGGVGKTTVSLGISAGLTKNYKRVLYIDAEDIHVFQRFLDNSTPISATDVYSKLASADDNIYQDIKHVIRKELFSYLPPFKATLMSLGLNGSVYEKIIKSAKKSNDFDYIIVDTDSNFDEFKVGLFGIADKVIIVTRQTASAVYATNIFTSNITGINSDKYLFICNDFNKDLDNALISPSIQIKFSVSDYIDHIRRYDQLKCRDLMNDNGIQKTTFLFL